MQSFTRHAATALVLSAGCAANLAQAPASPAHQVIATPNAPAAIGPYSQGVIAQHTLYAAGQIGLDPATGQLVPGDAVTQTERALANLSAVLRAGGAGWGDVVRTTVYVQNIADFSRINEAYARVLGAARPARTTVQVAALPRGALVAIDLIAVVP